MAVIRFSALGVAEKGWVCYSHWFSEALKDRNPCIVSQVFCSPMKRKRESFSPLITFWSRAKPEDLVNHFLWCIFMIEVLCVLQAWLTQFPFRKRGITHSISFVCDSWELRERKANWVRVWPSSLRGESPEQAACPDKASKCCHTCSPPVPCSRVSPAAAASQWIPSVSTAQWSTGRWIFFPYLMNQANCCKLQCATCFYVWLARIWLQESVVWCFAEHQACIRALQNVGDTAVLNTENFF